MKLHSHTYMGKISIEKVQKIMASGGRLVVSKITVGDNKTSCEKVIPVSVEMEVEEKRPEHTIEKYPGCNSITFNMFRGKNDEIFMEEHPSPLGGGHVRVKVGVRTKVQGQTNTASGEPLRRGTYGERINQLEQEVASLKLQLEQLTKANLPPENLPPKYSKFTVGVTVDEISHPLALLAGRTWKVTNIKHKRDENPTFVLEEVT